MDVKENRSDPMEAPTKEKTQAKKNADLHKDGRNPLEKTNTEGKGRWTWEKNEK